ncbi:(2Fe-2S)-binding protein [Candidatus Gracilibacteria bacterium]|nr:(2Fe-2S)-binding protein [Candidatus Gracilibacteria bacterium]
MPTVSVAGKTIEVTEDTRLVLAIEAAGIAIGHRCGGHAKCTTCRVVFAEGEPQTMTKAEHEKLSERDLLGSARLSCQILCTHDMAIAEVPMTLESQNWTDTGPAPEPIVTPEATWYPSADF